MEVGQLFFKLGFKSSGTQAAERFESVQSQLAETSSYLVEIFEQISFTLEKVALKMNAVTQEEVELFKQNQKQHESVQKLGEQYQEFAEEQIKVGKESRNTKGLFGTFIEFVDNSVGKMNRMRLQLIGVATAMTMISKRAGDYASDLMKFNRMTGLSTQQLQVLQRQAESVGIAEDRVTDAIQSLQQTSVDIQMGKGNKDAWQWLGLKAGQDPFQQLNMLQKRAQNLSRPMFVNLAKSAGFSDDVVDLLLQLKDMKPPEKNMILSEREIKDLRSFQVQFFKALDGMQIAFKKLGALLLPFTKQFVFIFDRWGWAIRSLTDKFNALSDKTKAWMNILLMIATVVAIKLFPLTAVITTIILLIDDFLVYMSGGKSLMGRFIEGAKVIFKELQDIILGVFLTIEEKIQNIKFLGDIFKFLNKFNPYAAALSPQQGNKGQSQTPYMQQMAAGMTTNNVTQNIAINIPGVDNPEQFAREVQKALKAQNTDGYFQNGTTGK